MPEDFFTSQKTYWESYERIIKAESSTSVENVELVNVGYEGEILSGIFDIGGVTIFNNDNSFIITVDGLTSITLTLSDLADYNVRSPQSLISITYNTIQRNAGYFLFRPGFMFKKNLLIQYEHNDTTLNTIGARFLMGRRV
ncbi:MAG: hypothetical protein V3U19_03745 [Thermodesulfobacteriota bacterium]